MPSFGVVTLAGKSGRPYKFKAYPLGTIFKKGLAAVYLLTQRTMRESSGGMRHHPVALGLSTNLREPDSDTSQTMHGSAANCVCIHAEPDAMLRQAIHEDLNESFRSPMEPQAPLAGPSA